MFSSMSGCFSLIHSLSYILIARRHCFTSDPQSPTPQVYTNGGAVPFMMPPFAAGTPLYPVAAPGIRPVKLEAGDM